ncbi:MAG: hypothetical protein AB1630_10205 [bacterium]
MMNNLPSIDELSLQHRNDGLFICAMGFEDRCTTGLAKLEKLGYICENVIMLQYDVNQDENKRNQKKLEKILKNISKTPFIISKYFVTDPFKSKNEFINALNIATKQSHIYSITVDITSFNSASIIQIFDLLLQQTQKTLKQIRIIYTEAKTYFPSKKDVKMPKEVYLSSGVKEIITLPRFNGIFYPGYSILLIIFLGFDPIRARGAINFLQPSRKIGIIGEPPRKSRKWRADEAKKRNIKIFDEMDNILQLSTFDYKQTMLELNKLYREFSSSSNIAICPLGSKLQTVGVFLFARNHPDVKLLFPIPVEFHPKRYSKGYIKTWQIVFDKDYFRNEGDIR